MRRTVAVFGTALAFVIIGAACLAFGLVQRRMAIAQEDFAVFDFTDPEQDYAALDADLQRVSWLSRGLLDEIRTRRAELRYWQRDYSTIADLGNLPAGAGTRLPADLRFLVANATYRQAQKGPQDRATLLRNLDLAIRAYADAVKAAPGRREAAFDYELVTRLRDEVANGKRKALPSSPDQNPPADAETHGTPGEPPKEVKVEQFKVRVPMDPKELKAIEDNQAGRGRLRIRRG
jgi:hypothetical protein